MSRSYKERHLWKSKERKRAGKRDPSKVKLHRERFLAVLKRSSEPVEGFDPQRYVAAVFQARLRFDPEEQQSVILFGEREIVVPFLVENSEDCHYAVAEVKTDFDAAKEKEKLDRHVGRAQGDNFPCHLEVAMDDSRLCSSIISCKYRQWDPENGQAICALPRK